MLLTFDDQCTPWKDNKEFNKMYIEHVICYLNTKLKATGWISLNDLYDSLGRDRSLSAQVYGWRLQQDKYGLIEYKFVETDDSTNNVTILLNNVVKLL